MKLAIPFIKDRYVDITNKDTFIASVVMWKTSCHNPKNQITK